MALKQLKEKNDYLEKNAEYYKEESNRGSLSRMFGGSRPAPLRNATREDSSIGQDPGRQFGAAPGFGAVSLRFAGRG